jgi:hypothetical protein
MSAYTICPGYFINTKPNPWINYSQSQGGKTVTIMQNGNIEVSWDGHTVIHAPVGGYCSKYAFIGTNNYLLLLDSSTSAGPINYRVSLINFDSATETPIIINGTGSDVVDPPQIQYSQGTGSAFLVFNATGSSSSDYFGNVGIYRSDNGNSLCVLGRNVEITSVITAQATGTNLIIYYETNGMTTQYSCKQPHADDIEK